MKKQQIKAGLASVLAGVFTPMVLIAPSVSAATATWAGHHPVENYDGKWATSSNWEDLTKPGTGDTAVFPVTGIVHGIENNESALSLAKLVFSGNNTFTSSKSYTITGNALTITSGIDAIMTGSGGDHKVLTDVSLTNDVVFKTTGSNTLTVGDDDTTLYLDDNDLTLQADGGTISLAGEIDGSGKLVKRGSGKVNMLATPTDDFSGTTEVTEGQFVVTETSQGNILVNGGILKGQSDLLGTVTMSAGAVAPGNSPGCLGTSDLTFTGGTYEVEINGTVICTDYDQITVEGTVNLGTETELDVSFGYEPETNTSFALILNDGTDAVEGHFKDFPDGQKRTLGEYTYQVNYNGGDGNDVILLVTGTPSAPDTGLGSVLTSPLLAFASVLAAGAVIGGLKFAEQRRK